MDSNHLTIYISKLLVHFEFKVRIDVVSRAKKTAKIGQNIIVINLSWHGGYGPFLSSFEVLDVPKTDNSSIVLRHHSKSSVPLGKHSYWLAGVAATVSLFMDRETPAMLSR